MGTLGGRGGWWAHDVSTAEGGHGAGGSNTTQARGPIAAPLSLVQTAP